MARRFVIGSRFGVVVVLGALAAFGQSYAGRVLPGIVLGGVDIGGMTEPEARQALDAALGGLEDGQIELVSSRTTAVIPYADVGRVIDDEGMLAGALGYGRAGTKFEEARAGIRGLLEPVTLPVVIDYDRDRLATGLAEFRDLGERSPVDASVAFQRKAFMAMPAADGVAVDTTRIASLIDQALVDPATPSVVRVTADSLPISPAISDEDAARAITAAERIAAPIEVTAGKRTWTITQARIASWMSFVATGADYGPVIDHADVPAALKSIKKSVLTKPRDAQYLRSRSGGIFGVAASSAGRALDVDATVASIMATLDARAAGPAPARPIKVAMMAVAPDLTTGEATRRALLVERIGSWTTYYQVSAHNGFAANITVPARRLNGIVVQPGQTFDFWRALGEVSFRTGYRLGGAIVGGHSVEGRALAGGICAASTTLFNAAARGGLQVVARQPHWYYITRYPLGLDATVSGSQTMRFRNDTAHPVLIKAHASPGVVQFEIWSVPNGRTVTWSKPHVTNVVRGYDSVRYTSALAPGARKRIEYPVDGKDVVVTRTVRDARGRVINRDTFVSHYHRMVGVTLIGR
ncbi:MAG TPA: VanW family protein [Desertimonas sp.]|nr:VanW family protein [Desertimonas sp.]